LSYGIVFKDSARKEAVHLPSEVRNAVAETVAELKQDPRPPGCVALQGNLRGYYRVRTGSYRIIYAVDDEARQVEVVAVRHRSRAYKQ
jgi:mRNA interferase RelE/StbE